MVCSVYASDEVHEPAQAPQIQSTPHPAPAYLQRIPTVDIEIRIVCVNLKLSNDKLLFLFNILYVYTFNPRLPINFFDFAIVTANNFKNVIINSVTVYYNISIGNWKSAMMKGNIFNSKRK